MSQGDVWGSIVGFTVTPGAAWLAVDTTSGAAAGATPVTIHASVDASQLADGGYDTTLAVTPSGGGTAISIPVHLTVETVPFVPPSAVILPAPAKKGGCGCRAAGEERGGEGWLVALAVAALRGAAAASARLTRPRARAIAPPVCARERERSTRASSIS